MFYTGGRLCEELAALPGVRSSEGIAVLAKDIGTGRFGFHHLAANLDLGNAPDEDVAASL